MKKPKRTRTVFSITIEPKVLAAMRKHCTVTNLPQSWYIEDLIIADLKAKGEIE